MGKKGFLAHCVLAALLFSSCASVGGFLGVNSSQRPKPIANPFFDYHPGSSDDTNRNMVLRTKKGDRSVELEIPGDKEHMSEFVLPVSPAFRDMGRSLASQNDLADYTAAEDEQFKKHKPSFSDHEIVHGFPQGTPDEENKRREIEQSLNLVPSETGDFSPSTPSYLASMDHIKQLYKNARFEAALLEADELLKEFQTDPKLYEMRGTLLERMGQRELALRSWNQSLRLNPKNDILRRFVERKQARSTAGLQ